MTKAIVVHHKSYATIEATVRSLRDSGIALGDILVVDNSEDEPPQQEVLRSLLDVEIIFIQNRGYGAAVNRGVEHLAESGPLTPYTLVTTHELVLAPESLRALAAALDRGGKVAAVGPKLLLHGTSSEQVWSVGGYLTKRLKLPRHNTVCSKPLRTSECHGVEWIDGACILYRTEVLQKHKLDESFFMYMEELEQQYRMRMDGWTVAHVPLARAWQATNGVPPYYLGRNMVILHSRHFGWWTTAAAVCHILAKESAKAILGRTIPKAPIAVLRGIWDGVQVVFRSR
ncbi:glycosyltransferase [Pseudonocardia lutea]|uniref:Glycosyltransferase n=1 Tax=Pseudonocardia lutea TaxID=2172015 RepID=A0ABW1I4Q0_9PSEU